MNFRQLEIFRAVMVSGSASRAAERLGITQPAVSRALTDLELRVGFDLFDRVKGRLVPTPEGQLFFGDVTMSFVGLDSLRAAAARIRDFGSGTVRIASLAALGSPQTKWICRELKAVALQAFARFASCRRTILSSSGTSFNQAIYIIWRFWP
jgi:DNA-binding transcriptional LysR family regulator